MIGTCRGSCDLRFVLAMVCLKELVIRECDGPREGGYPTVVMETCGALSRSQFYHQHVRHEFYLLRSLLLVEVIADLLMQDGKQLKS